MESPILRRFDVQKPSKRQVGKWALALGKKDTKVHHRAVGMKTGMVMPRISPGQSNIHSEVERQTSLGNDFPLDCKISGRQCIFQLWGKC